MKTKYLDLLQFIKQQSLACIFPLFIFGSLYLTKYISFSKFQRYDVLLLACLIMQILMLVLRLENKNDLLVICIFHLIGLGLEIFKVSQGSWSYPEPGLIRIANVPLFSGFLYASVASYISQAWWRLKLSPKYWPDSRLTSILSIVIYLNFFTNHFLPDIRWLILLPGILIIFWKTTVQFSLNDRNYQISMILSFFLISIFIWFAENISTYLGAWRYPYQLQAWQLVDLQKLSSWFLLVIISIIIVAKVKIKLPGEIK